MAVFVALALSQSRPFPLMVLSTFIPCALYYRWWDSNEIDRKELIESFFSRNLAEKINATLTSNYAIALCRRAIRAYIIPHFSAVFVCRKLTDNEICLSQPRYQLGVWKKGDDVIISVVSVHIVHA